jgi:RsiW-degrading membrane proteinase PrsW (M82 family)
MNDSLQYRLVFDISSAVYETWKFSILPGCIALVASVLSYIALRGRSTSSGSKLYGVLAGIAAVFTAAISVGFLIRSRWEYAYLRRAAAHGDYRTVQGRVTDFVAQGPNGHPRESFRIGDVVLDYSASDMTSAFHQTAGEGGPIREGLRVRIAYAEGSIVRLEVAK